MNKFIILKKSIMEMIEYIIGRNNDIRIYQKMYFRKIKNNPIRLIYRSANSVSLKIDIEVRFGVDILKAMDKITAEIKNNLEKLARVSAQSVELSVKGIFNEEKGEKDS